jgi:hypothetical protein
MPCVACFALALGLLAPGLVAAAPQATPAACSARDDAERASHRALRWEDFAGAAPDPDARRGDQNDTLAVLRTSIRIDGVAVRLSPNAAGGFAARVESACVQAYVLKRLSGRDQRRSGRAWQLRHEQTHFDLSAAFARELARRLARLTAEAPSASAAEQALRRAIAGVNSEIAREHAREQQRYDRETSHGHRRGAQARWDREVTLRLARREASSAARSLRASW